jgi:DNA repair ATPase RecN
LKVFNKSFPIGIDGEFELETLRKQLEQQEARALDLAHQVSGKRKESFASLQTKVENTLRNLGIEHGRLQIDCTDKDMSNSGIDEVSFLFTANKNHPVKEISKIASGGELSRLMLAVKHFYPMPEACQPLFWMKLIREFLVKLPIKLERSFMRWHQVCR